MLHSSSHRDVDVILVDELEENVFPALLEWL